MLNSGGLFNPPFCYFRKENGTYIVRHANGQKTTFRDGDGRHFVIVDLAASLKTSADWTVFSHWVVGPANELLLVGQERHRMESPDHEARLGAFVKRLPVRPLFVGIEDQTYGSDLIKRLKRKAGFIVKALKTDKDKYTRAIPAGTALLEGQFFIPADAAWRLAYEQELIQFPTGKHDDQVDVTSYAVLEWLKLPRYGPTPQDLDTSVRARLARDWRGLDRKRRSRGRAHGLG